MSYPDEQIGYLATEQYVSQSQPATPYALNKTLTNTSQPAMESPLRKASVPAVDVDPVVEVRTKRSLSQQSDEAMESSIENLVHIDDPKRRYNKITGGEETMDETQVPKPYIDDEKENGYSVPILAADEVAKGGDPDFMQPAVSPRFDRRSSQEPGSGDHTPSHSRPSSRPGSIYGLHSASHSLSRFISHHDDRDTMHTPLEDVDEYEPLFPDEESKQKALSHAERFKRPEALKHRFPSQDIWEDAPNSVMHQATVSTPDLPHQTESKPSAVYEPPEAEAAGKGQRPQMPRDDFLTKSRPHLRQEMGRPGMQPRFPSQDIWEDSPESYHLVTTVSGTPAEDSKPAIPPRPSKSKVPEAGSSQAAPMIPPRPSKAQGVPQIGARFSDAGISHKQPSPTELRKVPSIPDRPKPQVPPRPAKKVSAESLKKTLSQGSADSNETEKAGPVASPPLPKAKPQIPSRPGQNKFANLKGNFMNDLNQKLGLGPPKEKEKEPEPEVEAKPLEDARKGRARGPQRRAPAKSPVAAPAASAATFSFSRPSSLWHIDDGGLLTVGSVEALQEALSAQAEEAKPEGDQPPVTLSSEKVEQMDHATIADAPLPPSIDTESKAEQEHPRADDAPESMAPLIATNTAGDFPDPTLGTPDLEKSNPLSNFTTATTVPDEPMSQPSTESSEGIAKHPIEREDPDPATDAIPASKQTTASSASGAASADGLERFKPTPSQVLNPPVEKIAEEEPVELRNEQVSASAPGPSAKTSSTGNVTVDPQVKQVEDEKKMGSDAPKEPMPEEDVTYRQLEEMQSKADGKVKSDGDMGPTKVVE
jgi:hypothetical protein